MKKNICIKFAELFLKGKNRDVFIKSLFTNIKKAFWDLQIILHNNRDMFFLEFNSCDEEIIVSTLSKIPGISYFYFFIKSNNDINEICKSSLELVNKYRNFKIEVKRKNKKFIEREELISSVATYILDNNKDILVDVKNPNIILNIEVCNEFSILWTQKISGIGGFPIGINGSCLSLLSGGIDSPVASQQVQKKGQIVDYLTFVTNEVTEKTIEKLKKLINKITLDNRLHKPKLFIVDFTKVQHELYHMSNPKYRITLMRRSFYRIAEQIAKKYKYDALICGDSLGQVASQTIESISVISEVCNDIQIFRPLLIFDKLAIIKIAKEIGTYEISISQHEDVWSLFAPDHPITKPSLELAKRLENELELLNYLEKSVIDKLKIV